MGESIINQRQAVDTKTKAGIINKKERRRGRGERGQRKGRGGGRISWRRRRAL